MAGLRWLRRARDLANGKRYVTESPAAVRHFPELFGPDFPPPGPKAIRAQQPGL